jgi:hypothetical protein
MVDLFKATTIAFMGANGVEHLVVGIQSVMAGKSAPTVVPEGDSTLVPESEVTPDGSK